MVEQALMNSLGLAGVSIKYMDINMTEFYQGFYAGIASSTGSYAIYFGTSREPSYGDEQYLDSCLVEADIQLEKDLYEKAFKHVMIDEISEAGVYFGAANMLTIEKTFEGCRDVQEIEEHIKALLDYIQTQGNKDYITQSMISTLHGQ